VLPIIFYTLAQHLAASISNRHYLVQKTLKGLLLW
jgi:hypothetical protein